MNALTGVLWRNSWGSPMAWPNQSITRDSSSVQAGELAWWVRGALDYYRIQTRPWTDPGEAETVDAVRQHVAQQAGVAVEGGEVGVHVGGLPVGHPRHDAPLNVGKDCVPVLASVGGLVGDQVPQVTRLYCRENTPGIRFRIKKFLEFKIACISYLSLMFSR